MIVTRGAWRATVIALTAIAASSAHAATITWSNSAGGNYTTAANWSSATVPASADDVVFSLNNTYSVLFPTGSNRTNRSARVSGGDVTFNIGGAARNYTLTGTLSQQDLVVGGTTPATLTLTNGKLATPSTRVGSTSGTTGTLNVSTGATLDSDTYFIEVGGSGTGTLNINNGGDVLAADVLLGAISGGNGTLSVTGSGSTLAGTGALTVGRFGSGTLDVSGGATVTTATGQLGSVAGSKGTATITGAGSQWTTTGDLHVGGSANGAGGTGDLSTTTAGAKLTVGGLLKVWDQGSVTITYNDFEVSSTGPSIPGASSARSVEITGGGHLTTDGGGLLAYGAGSTGTVTVTGPGSQWNLGGLSIGSSGAGSLAIQNGGVVTSSTGVFAYHDGSSGTVTVDGTGSQWNVSGDQDIGYGGTGNLAIRNGGVVTSNSSTLGVGAYTNTSGTATIAGAGSQWIISSSLVLGLNSAGSLEISDGGVVTNTDGYLGENTRGSGTASIAGAGSQWTNSGDLYVGGSASGIGGTGILDVNSGGLVNVGGLLKIWSLGTVNLNGGTLDVGTLTNSGTFNFTSGTLNLSSLGIGTAGPLSSNYTLGAGRNLNVANATTIDLGSTLTIDGGTFTTGSLVKNGTFQFLSGTMDLGTTPLELGAGDSFNLGAGSTFTNTGALTIDLGATFAINGGTFTAGSVALNGGSFRFNSGTLNLTNSGMTFGAGGLLGANVSLDATRQVSVSGNAIVSSGSSLSLNGGTLNVGQILGINAGGTVGGQGTFTGGSVVVHGTLNLTGNSVFQNGVVAVGDAAIGGGTGQINIADGTTTNFYGGVYANGDGISVGAGGEAIYHGYLGGSGTLDGAGTHTALGSVGPGNSPGTLTVNGDFVFGDSATFDVELAGPIAGTGYDVMDVSGEAWLDGTLAVSLLDGFTPAAGQSFDVLFAEVLHGTFGSSVLPDLGPNLRWEIHYLLDAEGVDTLRLSAQNVPVPGAVWMLISALGALGYARRRQRLH